MLYCRVNGFKCLIERQLDDMLIVFSSRSDVAKSLNMEFVDRGAYRKTVPASQADCIWKVTTGGVPYETVEVLKGSLKVSASDVPLLHDNQDTEYCKNRDFAIHNGKKYKNYIGYNNKYFYYLGSYDIKSQDDGFIMETPGWFTKRASPEEIEIAFRSNTWCTYRGYKFTVTESDGNHLIIEQYSRKDYPDKLLKTLGFYIENTKWVKQVSITDIPNLWVINTPWDNFKKLQIKPDVIKGCIKET